MASASRSAVRYSVLDLSPILAGQTAADSFRNTLDLARHVERWGYERFWLAEHHNIPSVASAATAVLIGHVAGGTQRIRVGAGGIMLPNHSPLIIAEQFGTLESLYPGRIDLGLGRAPGGDQRTARAVRRANIMAADTFPQDVLELQAYFEGRVEGVHAVPGEGLSVPIYILGSSEFGAGLAAELGLPYAFASHFAPDALHTALALYRANFRPSAALAEPYAIVGVNVIAGETDEQGQRLATTAQGAFLNLVRGRPGPLQPPVDKLDWNSSEEAAVRRMTRVSAIGGPARVQAMLETILEQTQADELIIASAIYDHAQRVRSYEIAAEVMRRINAPAG